MVRLAILGKQFLADNVTKNRGISLSWYIERRYITGGKFIDSEPLSDVVGLLRPHLLHTAQCAGGLSCRENCRSIVATSVNQMPSPWLCVLARRALRL